MEALPTADAMMLMSFSSLLLPRDTELFAFFARTSGRCAEWNLGRFDGGACESESLLKSIVTDDVDGPDCRLLKERWCRVAGARTICGACGARANCC